MTTMMHRTSQVDNAMEAMRAGRGRGGRTACHDGLGCGRKQHGLKERRMWAGSEVGGDSSAGRQRAPVSAMHEFPEASSPTRQARPTSSPSQVLLASLLPPLPCLLTLPLSRTQCKTARRQALAGGDEISLLCQNLTATSGDSICPVLVLYLCNVLLLLYVLYHGCALTRSFSFVLQVL